MVRYYRTEAELWLAQARAGKEPRPHGLGPGRSARPGLLAAGPAPTHGPRPSSPGSRRRSR